MNKNTIITKLSESERIDYRKLPFEEQPIPRKVFWAIWAVEAEVNNGGFVQYFYNSSCETVPFVVKALETIGAFDTADICRRAIACAFPLGLPANTDDIHEAVADFSEEVVKMLHELDGEFIPYPCDLTALLFAYVSEHPEEFGVLPKPDDA
jgi:hypothetical protein